MASWEHICSQLGRLALLAEVFWVAATRLLHDRQELWNTRLQTNQYNH